VRISENIAPLVPQHAPEFWKHLSTEVTNIQTTIQKLETLESGPIVILELNIASATSAFLQRLTRGSHSLTIIPVYRKMGPMNQLHQVLAQLYLRSPPLFFISANVIVTILRYALGVPVNWQNYTKVSKKFINAKKVVLPTYAFDKVTCWFNDKSFRTVGSDNLKYLLSFSFL
jgi:hypothetical protein